MQSKVVIVPIADMRRDHDHRSERVSQLLYGHVVRLKQEDSDFSLVAGDDDYEGWVANSYLREFIGIREEGGKGAKKRQPLKRDSVAQDAEPSSKQWRTVVSTFAVFEYLMQKEYLILPFNSSVPFSSDGNFFVDFSTMFPMRLAMGDVEEPKAEVKKNVNRIARELVGFPYLWGGTSPYGFDCSGFVQAVFRRCGYLLPRDTKDQRECGDEVKWSRSRAGDLIFFPGHVALYLGRKQIIHATRSRGVVAIESLDPKDITFRHDLADKITTVRRVLS